VLCMAVALANFFIFGLPHTRTWVDASGFDAYGASIAAGHGYSPNNAGFNDAREPGYPLFVAALYTVFGIHNVLAVCIVQALLLGVLGFLIYLVFVAARERYAGYAAGVLVSALPSYGYYANEMLSELLFTFFLGLLFYLCIRVLKAAGQAPWWLYCLVGAVCASATLVRTQLVFFLPLLIICYWLYTRPWQLHTFKKGLAGFAVFVVIIFAWMLVVHEHTGHFAITEGRPAQALYFRAVRSQLSYTDNTRYLIAWLKRSVTGQETTEVPILDNNDEHRLSRAYSNVASTSASAAAVERQSVATILANPSHYLYGNLIEVVRLAYIDHDYSSYVNRYFRAGLYVVIYLFFAFGLYALARVRGQKDIKNLSVLSLLFIAYNFLVLTPFYVDPRYNTPYLMFYIVVGIAGVILLVRSKRSAHE